MLLTSTDQFFVMQGAGRQGRGDASLPGVLNQGLSDRRDEEGSIFLSSHLNNLFLIIKRNLSAAYEAVCFITVCLAMFL